MSHSPLNVAPWHFGVKQKMLKSHCKDFKKQFQVDILSFYLYLKCPTSWPRHGGKVSQSFPFNSKLCGPFEGEKSKIIQLVKLLRFSLHLPQQSDTRLILKLQILSICLDFFSRKAVPSCTSDWQHRKSHVFCKIWDYDRLFLLWGKKKYINVI